MSAHLFGNPPIGAPRSNVQIHHPARPDGRTTDAVRVPLHDWQADEDGPLTSLAIELALAPALAHPSDAVRAAARVCRRHLEALLTQETER
ncbi:hypothetical protein UFOVP314_8 [uncultured Caudovirales phage]|uniref:Uncharacterized protein n=1 Tax=uncultured Caudovirales phage TaxID=2100421 RepID=A0A6J5LYL5_9CAUD|nr:hypothetical protein UFOVP314_8 [uncultured Caudovirales phage]